MKGFYKYRIEIRKVKSEDQPFDQGEEFVSVKPDKAHARVSSIFQLIIVTFTKLYERAKLNEAREQIKTEVTPS